MEPTPDEALGDEVAAPTAAAAPDAATPPVASGAPSTERGEPLLDRPASVTRRAELDAAWEQWRNAQTTPIYKTSVDKFLRSKANPLYDEAKATELDNLRSELLEVMSSEEFQAEAGERVNRTAQNLSRVKYGEVARRIERLQADMGLDTQTSVRLERDIPSGFTGEPARETYQPFWPDENVPPLEAGVDDTRHLDDDELADRMAVLEKQREAAFHQGDLEFIEKVDERLQLLYNDMANKSARPRAQAPELPPVEYAEHEPGSIPARLAENRRKRAELNKVQRYKGWAAEVRELDAEARELRTLQRGSPVPDPLDPNNVVDENLTHARGGHPVPDHPGDPVFDQRTGEAHEAFTAADGRLHINLDAQAEEGIDEATAKRLRVEAATLMRERTEAYRRFQSEAKAMARRAAGTLGGDTAPEAIVDSPLAQAILAVAEAKTQLSTNRLTRTQAALRGRERIVTQLDARIDELVIDLREARERLGRLQHGAPKVAQPKFYGEEAGKRTAGELGMVPETPVAPGKRVLVSGSRGYKRPVEYERMKRHLDAVREEIGDFTVVAGGAAGADTLAIRWAKERGLPFEIHNAKWREEGRGRGPQAQPAHARDRRRPGAGLHPHRRADAGHCGHGGQGPPGRGPHHPRHPDHLHAPHRPPGRGEPVHAHRLDQGTRRPHRRGAAAAPHLQDRSGAGACRG